MGSSSMDSELENLEDSSGPENEHGFVYAHNLDTYKLSKKERIEKTEDIFGDDSLYSAVGLGKTRLPGNDHSICF